MVMKLFKRFLAYFIDMAVIMIIAQSISGVTFINKQLSNYNKYYDNYTDYVFNYADFKNKLDDYFDDKKITEKEYNKLSEKYEDYKSILDKYYDDNTITKSEYNKIIKKVDNVYQKQYKKYYYLIEKNSICYFVVYIVAVLGYFIGFNKLTDGQTLGKKLLRLRVTNVNGGKVTWWQYLLRTILLYQPIYYIARLIGVFMLDASGYYTLTNVFYNIQYYLEFLIIITLMIRHDGRGLHDLVASTKVVFQDIEGNIY